MLNLSLALTDSILLMPAMFTKCPTKTVPLTLPDPVVSTEQFLVIRRNVPPARPCGEKLKQQILNGSVGLGIEWRLDVS